MTSPKGTLLLGHPRSGTTLLRRLLGAHPDIYAPPELHLFGSCARALQSDTNALGLEVGMLTGLAFAGMEDAAVLDRLRTFPFGIMEDLTTKAGKQLWLEKTAFDIFDLPGIAQLCEDRVTYLGIVRHPLDVALSTIRFCDDMGRYPSALHSYIAQHPDPFVAFLHSWADSTQALIALGEQRPDSVTICRYEDLIEDPAGLTEDLFAAIGAAPFALPPELSGDPDGFVDGKAFHSTKVDKTRSEKWRSLPDFRFAQVPAKVRELVEMLGYDPLPEGAPRNQDEARRAYLMGLSQTPKT